VREFLASNQITVLKSPPCSPDLGPNDFFLFPKIKKISKGRHSDDIDDGSSEDHFTKQIPKFTELLGFCTFFFVWYSREHDVSETGSVSVLR
jgi:hypothetical protein